MIPSRHQVSPLVRQHFGDRPDRLAPFLTEGDPLADAAVESLATLPRPAREALLDPPLALAKTPAERARAERMVRFSYGLSRFLVGDAYADALGFPRTGWRFALPALRAVLARADSVRRGLPFGDQLALGAGLRYWDQVVEAGLADDPVTFAMPERLRAH
jgi:hypothetical protein